MSVRAFVGESALDGAGLALALAPGLTPAGLEESPSFFHGFATHPQVLSRGLVTLADITATRYFQYTPTNQRDPVLTGHGDRMRAECFSACNGVYARLDLLGSGFDGGDITRGTTNVDISTGTRQLLGNIGAGELMHLDVGLDQLKIGTMASTAVERKVDMPDRWVRAMGNVAELHHGLRRAFTLDAAAARAFVATLPAATASGKAGWLTPGRTGVRLAPRASAGAVYINGLHRLSALKRLLPHVRGVAVYGPADGGEGDAAVEVELPDARIVLGLTHEAWRGYSGEGALLGSLAADTAIEDADLISVLLAFEPQIDVARLAREGGIDLARVRSALAVLASDGRVGWDVHDGEWFHRELPSDPDRVTKDNPRLRAARSLLEAGAVRSLGEREFAVDSGDGEYRVTLGAAASFTASAAAADPLLEARCTCTWYLKHMGSRGPCKHVLAAWLMGQHT